MWSYGEEVYEICVKYMRMREEMREYTRELMRETHETGAPVMRTLFVRIPGRQDLLGSGRRVYVRQQIPGGAGTGGRSKEQEGVPPGRNRLGTSGDRGYI